MNSIRFGLLILLLSSVCSISGQSVQISNIFARDIVAEDNQVLALNFKDQIAGIPFLLGWIDGDNKQYAVTLETSKEVLLIQMDHQTGWKGNIQMVGISLQNVSFEFRKKNLSDHITSFSNMKPMTPGSINFSHEYSLAGHSFRWFCLAIGVLVMFVLLITSKNLEKGILIGFVIAWIAYDLRESKNRWDIFSDLSKANYEIAILKDADDFIGSTKEQMGDMKWTKEDLSGVINSYFTYQLADHAYVPKTDKSWQEKAHYVITAQPKKRKVTFNQGRYHLIRRARVK